jgi:two-component system nitrate/nitrite sensor histidine kinase NarX
MAQRLYRDTGIEVELRLAAPEELLDSTRTRAVLRVAQEAIRNIAKHAAASRVRLSTFLEPPEGAEPPGLGGENRAPWVLEISDNGRGFAVDEILARAPKRHFGLRFMRERAQLIGARLEIVSNPAVGTTVRLAVDPAKRS